MAIDEVKFGELIGTVGALVTTVANLQGAVMPAIKEVRTETARYRDETDTKMAKHDMEDSVVHAGVADLLDWMRGDGTPEEIGAKKTLNKLVSERTKLVAVMATIAFVFNAMGAGIIVLLNWIHK